VYKKKEAAAPRTLPAKPGLVLESVGTASGKNNRGMGNEKSKTRLLGWPENTERSSQNLRTL